MSHVLETVIRRSEAINQAQIKGEPVLVFDPRGHGAADFESLTAEVLSHRLNVWRTPGRPGCRVGGTDRGRRS